MRRVTAVLWFALADFAVLAPAGELRAALEFPESEIVLKPAIGASEVKGSFRFKNTGAKAVTITAVDSSCACTVPEKPAAAIAPGEEGALPFVLKNGERTGRQTADIQVVSDDGRRQVLRVVAEVPARVRFAPRLLLFRGADLEAKTATLTYATEPSPALLGVAVSSVDFVLLGEPRLEEGGVLKLALRPAGPAETERRASVRVRVRDGDGAEHTDILYLRQTP